MNSMHNAGLEASGQDLRDLPRTPRAPAQPRRGIPRGLALLLLLLLVFSCTSGASHGRGPLVPNSVLELGASERAEDQRSSLSHVFYRNNDAPPTPTTAELRELERKLEQAPELEVRELRELFGNDLELLAYATRDSDGDGVLDYRISEYRGKFFEGDVDVDGDGVRNVYDVAPYDARHGGRDTDGDGVPDQPGSFADRDGDGIPDHLDWSRRKTGAVPELQAGLFRDFGVILVERSARFSPELVQAVDDTMRFVFREPISTLRTVAVEDQLLISPDLGDNGFMLGQTQTLTVCVDSLDGATPLVMLGLVIHEVGHAWQLAQDFDLANAEAENNRLHFPPGSFTTSLERFGWELDPETLGEGGYAHRLYWPHFYATSPRYHYRGYAPNEWAAWFEALQRDNGPEFLRNSPAMTWGIVGPYSLTSPWEWHADHLMAAVYNRMDHALADHPNHAYRSVSPVLAERMLDTVQRQWSRFDYRNAAGTSIDRELGRRFYLSDAQVQTLVDRYVIPLVDLPMLVEAFALEPSPPTGVGGLVASASQTWTALRERVSPRVDELVRLPSVDVGALWRQPRARASSLERDLLRAEADRAASPASEPDPDETLAPPTDALAADALAVDTLDSPELGADTPDPAGPDAAPLRPARLREMLEHARPSALGDRHGAGRVGGVVGRPSKAGSGSDGDDIDPELAPPSVNADNAELAPLPDDTEGPEAREADVSDAVP